MHVLFLESRSAVIVIAIVIRTFERDTGTRMGSANSSNHHRQEAAVAAPEEQVQVVGYLWLGRVPSYVQLQCPVHSDATIDDLLQYISDTLVKRDLNLYLSRDDDDSTNNVCDTQSIPRRAFRLYDRGLDLNLYPQRLLSEVGVLESRKISACVTIFDPRVPHSAWAPTGVERVRLPLDLESFLKQVAWTLPYVVRSSISWDCALPWSSSNVTRIQSDGCYLDRVKDAIEQRRRRGVNNNILCAPNAPEEVLRTLTHDAFGQHFRFTTRISLDVVSLA